jgi:hypothetical protein
MAIDMGCLSCDTFRDGCIGKENACGDYTTIDYNRVTVDEPQVAVVPELVGPVAIPSPLRTVFPETTGETRQAKFARIGKKRQEQTLEAIRKLEHLANQYYRASDDRVVYTYRYTEEQAEDLLKPIEFALANLRKNLMQPAKRREHGLISED